MQGPGGIGCGSRYLQTKEVDREAVDESMRPDARIKKKKSPC